MIRPWLQPLPLIAILRGLTPTEAPAIGEAIAAEGFRVLEVPLNSPQPLLGIRRLVDALGSDCLIGAGTVMTPSQVDEVAAAGGRLIVMPHADTVVIRAAKAAGLICVAGVATPTEAFAAIAAGADGAETVSRRAGLAEGAQGLARGAAAGSAGAAGGRHLAGHHGAVDRRRRQRLRHRLGPVRAGPRRRRGRSSSAGVRAGVGITAARSRVMKITRLTTFAVPPRWLFLRIDTDAGISGWGEPVLEGRAHTVAAAVDELVGLPDRQGSAPRSRITGTCCIAAASTAAGRS